MRPGKTKSVVFNRVHDADLLAWVQTIPNFSRFVVDLLYAEYNRRQGRRTEPEPATVAEVRAVVRAELRRALDGIVVAAPTEPETETDDPELIHNLHTLF